VLCVCVRVCGGVRPRYGAFRGYSGSLVCVESGQRERPEILYDSPVLLGTFKKTKTKRITAKFLHSPYAIHSP